MYQNLHGRIKFFIMMDQLNCHIPIMANCKVIKIQSKNYFESKQKFESLMGF